MGRFVIYEDLGGTFRWRLRANNDDIIATSQPYDSKAAAKRAAESVRRIAPGAEIVEKPRRLH